MEKEKKGNWKTTRFTKRVRVKPEKLDWLKENKKTNSVAGFLDIIINQYKKQNGEIS